MKKIAIDKSTLTIVINWSLLIIYLPLVIQVNNGMLVTNNNQTWPFPRLC